MLVKDQTRRIRLLDIPRHQWVAQYTSAVPLAPASTRGLPPLTPASTATSNNAGTENTTPAVPSASGQTFMKSGAYNVFKSFLK